MNITERCIAAFKKLGPSTADEIAEEIGESVLAVRPCVCMLFKESHDLVKTGDKRLNKSGKPANVWALAHSVTSLKPSTQTIPVEAVELMKQAKICSFSLGDAVELFKDKFSPETLEAAGKVAYA